MANGKIETVRIEIETTLTVHNLLRGLVNTGLYGITIEEAAERIVVDYVRERLLDGRLQTIDDRTRWVRKNPPS